LLSSFLPPLFFFIGHASTPLLPRTPVRSGSPELRRPRWIWPQCHHRLVIPVSSACVAIVFPLEPRITFVFTSPCRRSTRRSPPPAGVDRSSVAIDKHHRRGTLPPPHRRQPFRVSPSLRHLVQHHHRALLVLEGKTLSPAGRCSATGEHATAP
jgi:hypothetical protein